MVEVMVEEEQEERDARAEGDKSADVRKWLIQKIVKNSKWLKCFG